MVRIRLGKLVGTLWDEKYSFRRVSNAGGRQADLNNLIRRWKRESYSFPARCTALFIELVRNANLDPSFYGCH